MKDILWIIQDSNGQHYNWVALMDAIKHCGSKGIFCKKEKLKYLRNDFINLMIGGDDFLEEAKKNAYIDVLIMYDSSFFNIFSYKKIWGELFLNYDFTPISLTELSSISEGYFFVRPLSDDKCFDGKVYEIPKESNMISDFCIKSDCRYWKQPCICISKVKQIDFEWRVVIIESQIITICQYAKNSNSCIDKNNISTSLIKFCEEQICNVSGPCAWVVDVAAIQNQYRILECNIFNACNFYDCDRRKIVIAFEKALKNHESNGIKNR